MSAFNHASSAPVGPYTVFSMEALLYVTEKNESCYTFHGVSFVFTKHKFAVDGQTDVCIKNTTSTSLVEERPISRWLVSRSLETFRILCIDTSFIQRDRWRSISDVQEGVLECSVGIVVGDSREEVRAAGWQMRQCIKRLGFLTIACTHRSCPTPTISSTPAQASSSMISWAWVLSKYSEALEGLSVPP